LGGYAFGAIATTRPPANVTAQLKSVPSTAIGAPTEKAIGQSRVASASLARPSRVAARRVSLKKRSAHE
jgi:hypothetical protein